jgi:hypothetical protein
MYEHHQEPLLSRVEFVWRMVWHAFIFLGMVAAALFMGAAGYHWLEDIPWVDAVLNASMILGGMGPVDVLRTEAGKLFASGYALFSGLIFVAAMGVLFLPLVHRLLHKFHIEDEDEKAGDD